MVARFLNNSALLSRLAFIGLLLLLSSISSHFSSSLPKVQAASCAGKPVVYSNKGQATNWRLQEWLTYTDNNASPRRQIPIGPSRWTVSTRLKDGANENCFVEDWRVQRVIFQSSRDSNRGRYINFANAAANGIGFNGASGTGDIVSLVRISVGDDPWAYFRYGCAFRDPSSQRDRDRYPACFKEVRRGPAETAFQIVEPWVDLGRDQTTVNWSPTGQYGLLFTSSNNLAPARGYIPTEWLITGN